MQLGDLMTVAKNCPAWPQHTMHALYTCCTSYFKLIVVLCLKPLTNVTGDHKCGPGMTAAEADQMRWWNVYKTARCITPYQCAQSQANGSEQLNTLYPAA